MIRRGQQGGFTLVEVIVAIAILAIAMAAIFSGMTQNAYVAAELRQRTLALMVAHNRMTEIELETVFPRVGRADGLAEMAGTDWRWHTEVVETEDPELRRVDIRVLRDGGNHNLATLTGFISRTGRDR